MTLQEILENVMMDIDEDIDDYEVVNVVTKFINRAYKDLAKKEYLEKITTLTFVDGVANKPTDFYNAIGLYVDDMPVQYEIQGNNIKSDYDSAILIYNYLPDELINLEDETVTNESNIEYLIAYAEYLYFRMEGMFEEMNIAKNDVDSFRITMPKLKFDKIIDVYGM